MGRHRLRPATAAAMRGTGQNAADYILTFDGLTNLVNCGSGATLDNLADAQITVDGWFRYDALGAGASGIVGKGANRGFNNGWALWTDNGDKLVLTVAGVTSAASGTSTAAIRGNGWHHFAGHFNDAGDRKPRIAIDGIWAVAGAAVNGAVIADAANSLIFGRRVDAAANYLLGSLAWVRISNNDRFGIGANFAANVPARCAAPAVDANTIELWTMNEGAGATAAASVTSPTNDGAITGATWAVCA